MNQTLFGNIDPIDSVDKTMTETPTQQFVRNGMDSAALYGILASVDCWCIFIMTVLGFENDDVFAILIAFLIIGLPFFLCIDAMIFLFRSFIRMKRSF